MATSCHPNHTKRSIPYCQALRILRICSSKESAKLRCTELVDCLVKRGYNKSKTNKQIERAFTHFVNPPTGRQCHTTRPVYFNMQYHPSLPDIKGILQRYMPLLHQSVTMKTVVPDLPLISFSQPHNLCRSLCRAKLRQAASVNDEPPRPSQSCGKSRCKLCLSLICSNNISSTANNKTFKCCNENTTCDSKWIIYVFILFIIIIIIILFILFYFILFLVPSVIYNTWARVTTLELALMDTKVTSDSTPLVRLIRWTISFYMII